MLGGGLHRGGVPAVLDEVVHHPAGDGRPVHVHVQDRQEYRDPQELPVAEPVVAQVFDRQHPAVARRDDRRGVLGDLPLRVPEERRHRARRERRYEPQLRLRARRLGDRRETEGDTGRGQPVRVDVHGPGQAHARRPVCGLEPFGHGVVAGRVTQPVHAYRRHVAQDQVAAGAEERDLPFDLVSGAAGLRGRRHGDRQHTAGVGELAQVLQAGADLLGGTRHRFGEDHHVGRVGLAERLHDPYPLSDPAALRGDLVAHERAVGHDRQPVVGQQRVDRGADHRRAAADDEAGLGTAVAGELGGERAGRPRAQRGWPARGGELGHGVHSSAGSGGRRQPAGGAFEGPAGQHMR